MVIRMNRPERLNALNGEMRAELADAWTEFDESSELEVAIYTGTGRAFCAGLDLNELVGIGPHPETFGPNRYQLRTIRKPIIAAVNGLATGFGFALVELADLRVAARTALFESSLAKRWMLGGFAHGHVGNIPRAVATEMAFAFRFEAPRLYEVGFLNRLVDEDDVVSTARTMAEHLLGLAPATRLNTLTMMREVRPRVSPELAELADRLRQHGAKGDPHESRLAFTEKRPPVFQGWEHPEDRKNTPTLESMRRERETRS
jgi:enoyl-CoA hydratase/carnithine racemase